MKIATSTNIYFERNSEPLVQLEKCIELSAEAGFNIMDFGFVELGLVSDALQRDNWKEEIRRYKEFANDKEIVFSQAHATIFDFCNITESDTIQKSLFERSIEAAKLLGADWIVVHPSTGIKNGKYDPDTHKKNVDFFKFYSVFAERIGIGIAIENMWGKTKEGINRYCKNPIEVKSLIDDVGRDNVKICWDVEHASVEDIDNYDAITLLGNRIVATHISDETGPDNIHVLPYTGKVNWEKVAKGLAVIGFDGLLDLEIQHYLPGMPHELVLPAMKLAYLTGEYLYNDIESRK